jgi:hypothetical protein
MSQVERIPLDGGRILFRRYHDNGAMESEAILTHEMGAIEGISRHWHANGTLAEEFSVHNGVYDGVHRIWDANGKLLDEFEMKMGTGVLRIWTLARDSQWRLIGETPMINGRMTGRQRCYADAQAKEGFEFYWINGKKVSKKRYLEASAKDPKLPRYEGESPLARPEFLRAERSKKSREAVKVSDDLPLQLLRGSNVREALAWLEESSEPSRSLGEATSQGNSIKLVKKLYSLGAVAVHAVEIDGVPDAEQNSGKLVVELPPDAEHRKQVLAYTNRRARRLGFDPDPDGGQRYVLLMLD